MKPSPAGLSDASSYWNISAKIACCLDPSSARRTPPHGRELARLRRSGQGDCLSESRKDVLMDAGRAVRARPGLREGGGRPDFNSTECGDHEGFELVIESLGCCQERRVIVDRNERRGHDVGDGASAVWAFVEQQLNRIEQSGRLVVTYHRNSDDVVSKKPPEALKSKSISLKPSTVVNLV